MLNKKRYLIGLLYLIIPSLIGFFLIHRGTIKKADMIALSGKVLSKDITSIYSFKGGRHYFLVFRIENVSNKIAINYAKESQLKDDSAISLVNLGKTYTFYLDPTYPTENDQNNGINIIEENGLEIYKVSTKANLYAGSFLIVFGLTLFLLITKYKKKENSI